MKKNKNKELLDDIVKAQTELEIARRNFEFVKNPDLIEIYTHKIIAARLKCDYLIKKAKSINLLSQARDM